MSCGTHEAQATIGEPLLSSPGGNLARAALCAVDGRWHGTEAYAEAEALLQTGWKPWEPT